MTKEGFVPLQDLQKGNLVMVDNFMWRQKKENGGRKPFPTQEVSVGKYHPYAKKKVVDG